MNDELIAALDDCLRELESDAEMDAALARYPDLASELRPMLEVAGALTIRAVVPRRAEMSSRARFLASAAELRTPARPAVRRPFAGFGSFATRALTVGVAFLLGFVAGTYGLVTASAQSLPGDRLYGVKRAVEQTQLIFSLDPQSQSALQKQFGERRIQEVRGVTAQGRTVPVEFTGTVEGVAGERWSVAGFTVIVPPGAEIVGNAVAGSSVTVSGATQPDGTVLASRVVVNAEGRAPAPASPALTATPQPARAETTVPPTPRPSSRPPETQTVESESTGEPSETTSPNPTEDKNKTPEPTRASGSGGGPGPSASDEPESEDDGDASIAETPETDDDSGPSASNTPKPEDNSGSGSSSSGGDSGGDDGGGGSGGGGGDDGKSGGDD